MTRYIVCVLLAASALAVVTDCAMRIWAATDYQMVSSYDRREGMPTLKPEPGAIASIYNQYEWMIYAVLLAAAIGVIAWHLRKSH